MRSCYRLLKWEQDQREANSDGESGASEETHWWKRLWKLKILPKVHIFWWRAMNGYLPTKGELRRRHIACEDHCEGCGEEGEGLFHIAFKCTFAVGFWQKVKEIIGCKVPALHPATWTRDLLSGDVCSERDVALIVCGVWSLWSGRNARCHGKIKWNAIAAAKHIAAMIEDLMGMHISEERKPARGRCHW